MNTESDDRRLKELAETAVMHRFEAVLLFGQLTVYLAVFGALLNAVCKSPSPIRSDQIALSIVGLGVTLAFMVINHRAATHLLAIIRRAEDLSRDLGMSLYAQRPTKWTIFSGLNAVRFLYFLGLACWLYFLVRALT